MPKRTPIPGDIDNKGLVERMIRVDHAGEYGAVRIYQGQLAFLKKANAHDTIHHMLSQEKHHLEIFTQMIQSRRIRPTALLPLWDIMGFALGAGTALLGEKAAMACTVAIEEVIEEHYANQIDTLQKFPEEQELRETCEKLRAEEIEHRDTGLEHDAEKTLGYGPLTQAIKTGSRIAIWLSERV